MSTQPRPNILVCGTPGTGKTTLAESLAETLGFSFVNVGSVIREKGFHSGRNTEFDAYDFDEASEEKLLDELEPTMSAGGVVVEFHSVDFFPERWFDLVLVLRTENSILYDRLQARQYSSRKVEENVTAEIMQVVLEEARESYAEEIVCELASNSLDDLASNVRRCEQWYHQWRRDNPDA